MKLSVFVSRRRAGACLHSRPHSLSALPLLTVQICSNYQHARSNRKQFYSSLPQTMKAVRVNRTGEPQVLEEAEVPVPVPQRGEVLIKNAFAGVNFIDIYFREGRYASPTPFVPGLEGSGEIAALGQQHAGDGIPPLKEGQRVAYVAPSKYMGTYAEYTVIPASFAVPLPDEVSLKEGAAAMLQGMTAHYLLHDSYAVKPGDDILIHAAAGGTGLLLCQLGKELGARVIGTASTKEKAEKARAAGASEVILYTQDDFVARVKELTIGRGVNSIYDSVGKTTFLKGFDCLKTRGTMVLFGASSGAPEPIDPLLLMRGSFFLTRPSLFHFIQDPREYLLRSQKVLEYVKDKKLKLSYGECFSLNHASKAHTQLQGRHVTGKLLLQIM